MGSFFKNLKHSYIKFCNQEEGKVQNIASHEKEVLPLTKIRIYLTENCNANCSHCFNSKIREDKHMETNTIIKLFDYFNKNGVSGIKIMGGEPTIHPDFKKIYKHSQKCFENVGLFTNALNEVIFDVKPRPDDGIIYNFLFINEKFDFSKLLPDIPSFPRGFEIVIDSKTDLDSLFKRIEFTYSKCKSFNLEDKFIKLQLTLNCVENIFECREILNKKFLSAINMIKKLAPDCLSFDHQYPLCFWLSETIEEMSEMNINMYKGTCLGYDAGLIDSEFNLLHCNQYPVKLLNLLNPDGEFPSFNFIRNTLMKSNMEKRIVNFEKGCKYCGHFNILCTGSCFMHKDFIPGYRPNIVNDKLLEVS